MRMRRAVLLAGIALLAAPIARSGHEQPVYPSYYPHEIEIAAIAPERAAELMRAGKLQAYLGELPTSGEGEKAIAAAQSLGSLLVVRLAPGSALAADPAEACAVTAAIARSMEGRGGFVLHPYPVTPFHGDYLHHADRAEAASERLRAAPPPRQEPRVRAEGALARSLLPAAWRTESAAWDAKVEEVSAARLLAESTVVLNGWLGPRWVRFGWYHAWRALAPAADPARSEAVDALARRLMAVDYETPLTAIELERALVEGLASDCRAMVVGYTVRREHYSAAFTSGIENLAVDALEGLSSPMFLRTVKLKDFPWNGWLQLGLAAAPAAAWSPVGGFDDAFGRLLWYAVGDPAAIPSPYEATWTLNRISEVEAAPAR